MHISSNTMERYYTVGFILMLVGFASCGTPTPENVKDASGNMADGNSNITWAKMPSGDKYHEAFSPNDGGLRPLYDMAKKFLNMIQPEDLPYDSITNLSSILGDPMGFVMTVLGFGICFAIGILFIIIMPIVGCCFCCCRLCGNCGGKKVHKKSDIKSSHCIIFTVFVFVMAAFIGIPAACSLFANEQTSNVLKSMGSEISNDLDNIDIFMKNTVQEVKHASVTNYKFTIAVLERDLNNIDVILGEAMRDQLIKDMKIDDALQKIIKLNISMHSLKTTFNQAKAQQAAFKTESDALKAQLNTERLKVIATQGVTNCDGVTTCNTYPTNTLNIDADPNNIPDITPSVTLINSAASKNLTAQFETASQDFYDMPKTVKTDTTTMRTNIVKDLKGFIPTIESSVDKIDQLTANLNFLTDAKKTIKSYSDLIPPYDKYRWYGGIGLASLLLMIAGFQFVGAGIGACTYKSKVAPTKRSCCSNTGANFLMASVGFMFIFSWLLMLLTSITFLVGGSLTRFVCEPLLDPTYKIFKELIDKKDGFLGEGYFLGTLFLGDKTQALTIHGILYGCKNSGTSWSVLMLDRLVDLSKATDYKSQVDLKTLMDKNNIDVSNIKVLEPALEKTLDDFSSSLNPDFTLMIAELNKDSVKTPLTSYADGLLTQANLPTITTTTAGGELRGEAAAIKSIDQNQKPKTDAAKNNFKASLEIIQKDKATVQADIAAVKKALGDLDNKIKNDAATLINDKIADYLERFFGVMDSFVAKLGNALKEEVGVCKPLWNLYDSIVNNILCKSVADTLNGFWFCLGWATIFFIPAIIFAVKLNKYLRKCEADKSAKKHKSKRKKGMQRYVRGDSPFGSNRVAPE